MNSKYKLFAVCISIPVAAGALLYWNHTNDQVLSPPSQATKAAGKPDAKMRKEGRLSEVGSPILVTPDEIARTAAAKPCAKTVITHLDLSRPPTEAELIAAGNLGEALTPTRPADPPENSTLADKAKAHAVNLSFGHAIQAWNEHRYADAYRLFEQHLKDFPDSPWFAETELHLGCHCQYNGRLVEAADWFDRILKTVPKNSEMYFRALLRQSILNLDRGNFDVAHEGFAEMKKNDPDPNHQTYASSWIREISFLKNHETALRDCGQKALAKAAEAMGNPARAATLRALTAAGPHGFTAAELHGTALTHGFDSKPVRADTALDHLPVPFVAHYKDHHYVTVTRVDEDFVRLFDTRVGETEMSIQSFRSQWSGFALLFAEPPATAGVFPAENLDTIMGGCCGFPRSQSDLGDEDDCNKNCGMPGWSVNPVNYNLRVSDTPMWWEPPVGPPVMMSLLNNSLDSLNNYEPFGEKWSFLYASYLLVTPGSQVQVRDGSGRLQTFSGPAGGGGYPITFTAPGGDYRTLVEESSHVFTLTNQDGTIYRYGVPSVWVDPAGPNDPPPPMTSNVPLLRSIEDRHGNMLSIHHNQHGAVVAVSHSMLPSLGGVPRFWRLIYNTFSGHERVERIDDPFNRHAHFSYDSNGNLTGQTDMGGLQYGYRYTSSGELFINEIQTPKGVTSILTEPADGNATMGNITQGYSSGYPPIGWGVMWDNYRIRVTDPENKTTEYHYEALVSKRGYMRNHIQLQSAIQPFDGACTYFTYRLLHGKGKLGDVMVKTTGNGTQKYLRSDAYFTPWQASYGTFAMRLERTGSDGKITSQHFNDQGRVVGVMLPKSGGIPSATSPYHTTINYEANGVDVNTVQRYLDGATRTLLDIDYHSGTRNIQKATNALGQMTTFAWHANGLPQTITNLTTGDVISYEYDQGVHDTDGYITWRLLRVKINGTIVSRHTHDSIGRVQTESDSFGDFVLASYDNLNRLTRLDSSDDSFIEHIWECCFISETRTGTVENSSDRIRQRTKYYHDGRGLMEKSVDSAGRVTMFGYDDAGRMITLTDSLGRVTTWTFDDYGRPDKKIYPGTTYEQVIWHPGYLGVPGKFRNRAGTEHTVTYDEHQNLKTLVGPDINITRTYDGWDRLDTIKDTAYLAGVHDFAHDLLGRVTEINGPWNDDTLSWQYLDSQRKVTRTSPGGITETVTADALGRVASVVNSLGTFTHGYAAETSRPLSITHSGGFDTLFTYLGPDDRRALDTLTAKRPGGSPVSMHTYGYDDLGRIDSWQRDSLLANPTGTTRSFKWTAHHDFASQLVSVAERSLSNVLEAGWDYGYDLAGNMSSVQTVTAPGQPALATRRGHNALNQIDSWGGSGKTIVRGSIDEPGQVAVGAGGGGMKPARMLEGNRFEAELSLPEGNQTLRVTAADASGNTSNYAYNIQVAHAGARVFSHDSNGNLQTDGIRSYEWDSQSRLKKVTWDATRTTEFKYNALGQRCERIDKTGATVTAHHYFLIDGIRPVSCYTGGTVIANIDRRYLNQGEQRKNGAAWDSYYYTRDHLGSVREVLASNGALVARYDYDPYGKRSAQYQAGTYTNGCDFGFTGHVTLASPVSGQVELVLTHFRAYDPELGRWLPAAPRGEPGGGNLYRYVNGQPLRYFDPDGRWAQVVGGAVIGGLYGGIVASTNGGSFWKGAASGAVGGAVFALTFNPAAGASAAALVGAGIVAGGISGAASGVIGEAFDLADPCADASVGDILEQTAYGAMTGGFAGPFGTFVSRYGSSEIKNKGVAMAYNQIGNTLFAEGTELADQGELLDFSSSVDWIPDKKNCE
jgi:RHS repeat-associated protein